MSAITVTTPQGADSFDNWWDAPGGEWVEPPNHRRGGESGVKRLHHAQLGLVYIKQQVDHLYRDLLHPLGRPTVLRERTALLALPHIGLRVPQIVYCETRRLQGHWRALLVTRALVGFRGMNDWYKSGGRDSLPDEAHRRLLAKIGRTIGTLHRHHWQHACLYPKHIFISETAGDDGVPDVALIDLEKCRRRVLAPFWSRHDLKQLRRHNRFWGDADWAAMLEAHQAAFARAAT